MGKHGRLAEWAKSRIGAAFQWGENDCAMLCFEAIDVMQDAQRETVSAQYRGKWHDMRQALRFQADEHINLETALLKVGAFRWQGAPLVGDFILHPHPRLPFMSGHVCLGDFVIGSNEANGVFIGLKADAVSQPNSFVMRMPGCQS